MYTSETQITFIGNIKPFINESTSIENILTILDYVFKNKKLTITE